MSHKIYQIPDCENLDGHPCYNTLDTCPDFQTGYEDFKQLLVQLVNNKEGKTFYKFGDGDYYFLKQIPNGSAAIGNSCLSVDYKYIDMKPFVEGVPKNDYWIVELYPENRSKFKVLYPELPINFPAEYTYAIVTSRWITKSFAGKIGVLGGAEKINLIKKLMQYKQYQDYLGLESFTDYITIPEKYACDNIKKTMDSVAEQLENATSEIFVLGIGHTKNALLSELPKMHKAVYLDVGTGVNALAGIVSLYRPYCAGWQNHMLSEEFIWDYNEVDMQDYYDTEGKNKVILTT